MYKTSSLSTRLRWVRGYGTGVTYTVKLTEKCHKSLKLTSTLQYLISIKHLPRTVIVNKMVLI